jgi:HYR domain-containing protein/Calx-beta domain-containing protein
VLALKAIIDRASLERIRRSVMKRRKKCPWNLKSFFLSAALIGGILLPCLINRPVQASLHIGSAGKTTSQDGGGPLDQKRKDALWDLYGRLKSGDPFSAEETQILNRFAAGESIEPIEADVVISRVLYLHFMTKLELTKEQQELLDIYTASVARRQQDIADRKAQHLAMREQYWATHTFEPAAPLAAGDTCATAEVIPGAGPFPYLTSVTPDITGATTTGDPPLPSCQSSVSRSIWYTFTPTTTAAYTLSLCADAPTGTTVDDTVMAVYTSSGGCAGPFTQVSGACDDDSCVTEALQSVLTTTLNSGTTYYIVVWEFGTTPPTTGNTAVQMRVTQMLAPSNDTCATAIPLTLNQPVSGSTAAGTNDYQLSGSACFVGVGQTASTAPGLDVAYSFTPSVSGQYSFRVTGASFNAVVYVATSCPAGPPPATVTTCIAAANRSTSTSNSADEVDCVSLTAGTQYFFIVDGATAGVGGSFTAEVNDCTPETEPNDTPAQANSLGCPTTISINPASDVDFFNLGTPAAGSRIFALADGISGNTNDLQFRITTTTDTLEFDDDDGDAPIGTLSPVIGGFPATGGQLYLRVNRFNASTVMEPGRIYTVVQPPIGSATPETEPNDTIANANASTTNYFSGSFSSNSDVDIYRIAANAGDNLLIIMDGDPLRNATPINGALALLDSSGTTIVSSNDGDSSSSTTASPGTLTGTTPNSPAEGFVYRVPTTGIYYVRCSTSTVAGGDYLLSITNGCTPGATQPQISISDVSMNEGNSGTTTFSFMVTLDRPSAVPVMVTGNTANGTAVAPGDYTAVVNSVGTFNPGVTQLPFSVNVNGDTTAEADETFFVNLSNAVNATIADSQGQGTILNDDGAVCTSITCPANVTQANDPNQCGAVVNYPAPTPTGTCGTIVCTPASGSFYPKGTTTVTCTSSAGPSCSFTITVNDTQAPSITCPGNVTAVGTPGGSGVVVTYPAPTTSDNCPGVTASCVPASGSTFPVGTTTVTCTATDASSNTAMCTFVVTSFDACLQDDTNPSTVLLINSATGDYRFCCSGTTYTGKGTVKKTGSTISLTSSSGDRRVQAQIDGLLKRGTATLESPPGTIKCTITDRNTANNTCSCN